MGGLKGRYGPRYTKALLGVAFVNLFSPIPGSWLVSVAAIVMVAEIHRAIVKRGGFPKAITDPVAVVKTDVPWWATGRRRPPP